jgi:large subunit ribosomal protein L9
MAKTKSKARQGRPRLKRLPKGPHGGIELLLIHSVDHLGKQGDVVEVRPGYAHNYLLPQGLATIATPHHKRMVEKHREKLREIERKRLSRLQDAAAEIGRQSITIEANANDEGHLYGSVGAPEIVKALKQANLNVTTDQVRLEGPLKELGLYTVKIHLHHEVEADLKVWVVPTADASAKVVPEQQQAPQQPNQ